MKKVFVIDEKDNVGTAVLDPLMTGDEVSTNGAVTDVVLKANGDIPFGHKIALRDIPKGQTVMKYGLSIGSATQDIQKGDHVHIHNVESNRGRGDKFAAGVN
jgi:altronate dehydratase small subunit